jgi:hypothetical protein
MNGLASVSDGGDDTASQGGSESDASRTDGRHHERTGSVKKPSTFKPVSFAKFAVPKAPGTAAPPKVPEKGMSDCRTAILGQISNESTSAIDFDHSSGHTSTELSATVGRKGNFWKLRFEARFKQHEFGRFWTRSKPSLEQKPTYVPTPN